MPPDTKILLSGIHHAFGAGPQPTTTHKPLAGGTDTTHDHHPKEPSHRDQEPDRLSGTPHNSQPQPLNTIPMINKFITKMKDPKERRLFYAIFGEKLLGVAVCFLVVLTVSFFVGSATKARA